MVLMIFSHTLRSLVDREEMSQALLHPSLTWAAMLLTKAATPLFLICSGIALSLAQGSGRLRLLRRAALLWLSYQGLLLLEVLLQGGSAPQVWLVLSGQTLSRHGEILRFYALFLALAPAWLPLWRRSPCWLRGLWVPLPWLLASAWTPGVDEPGSTTWRWSLLGAAGVNTFPLLPWSPLVLLGLLLGVRLTRRRAWLLMAGAWLLFGLAVEGRVLESLEPIVLQRWKRPPNLAYLGFCTGFALLALAALVPNHPWRRQPASRHPLEVLGRRPLLLFNVHFPMLFGLEWLRPQPLELDRCWAVGLLVVLTCLVLCLLLDRFEVAGFPATNWPVLPAGLLLLLSWLPPRLCDSRIHLACQVTPALAGPLPLSLWFPGPGWQLRWDGTLWARTRRGWLRLTQACPFEVLQSPKSLEVDCRVSLPQEPETVRAYLSLPGRKAEPQEVSLERRGMVYSGAVQFQLRAAARERDSLPPLLREWE